MGVLTWSPLAAGFLSGRFRASQPVDMSSGRAALQPARFDPSLPVNTAKLDLAERLAELAAELGVSLPELAVAFPVAHPGVTSTIIGPRTMEQLTSLLKGASLVLDDATLDRIDEIVAPGTDTYKADGAWNPCSLTDLSLRRRPLSDRSAS
jgi:aryl-alcohol dehydrogenase-like predicted oxidoreductase